MSTLADVDPGLTPSMQWSIADRARLVMSLAHGEARLADLCAREGLDPQQVAWWVSELLHAAPELLDADMLGTLSDQGLTSDGPRTQQFGRLDDVGALDLLQSLGIYKKAGQVLFFHPHGISVLWFRDGRIVDARSGALRGAEAIYRIAGHERGDFLVEVTGHERPEVIELPTTALVFEAARQLDEAHRLDATLPDPAVVLRGSTDPAAPPLAALFGDDATMGEVLERSDLGELWTRRAIAEGLAAGWLEPTNATRPAEVPSVARRAAAMQQAVMERSQPLVAMQPVEPRPPVVSSPRRAWVIPAVSGIAAALIGALVALGGGSSTSEDRGAEGDGELQLALAPEPEPRELDTAAVGTPRLGPPPDADENVEATDDDPSGAEPPEAAEPGDDESSDPTTAPEPHATRSRSRSRSRAQSRAAPAQIDRPAPRTSTAVAPEPSASEGPKALLARARAAYAAGRGSTAYRLASRSNRLQPTGDAAELMTLASCLMKRPAQAYEALQAVPLLRRPSVRAECKQEHGVRPKREW